MSKYPRGSEWRKWDLQVHTPNTKLADQYKVTGSEKVDVWDKFLDYIRKSDVEVFGITDYFSIDAYTNLLSKIKGNKDFVGKVFFPNIEFRLDISTNKDSEEINIHLIFDNAEKVVKEIPKFLSKLETVNTKSNGTHYLCTPEDLVTLGYDQACISLEKLQDALRETFGKDKPYLIVGASNGNGGIRADTKSPRKMGLSDEVDKGCDFFFGRQQDQDYFLKEDRYEDKTIKAIPKAVVATSDCHSFEDCENFLGKQYEKDGILEKDITWIKANPTFEGLRQITFEPTERVKIQADEPDIKRPYFIIDKVRFIDNTGKNYFASDYIPLNQNLNAVVGGKSTGKSLLLYYVAKTIDENEVHKTLSGGSDVAQQYSFEEDNNFDFEVVWKDGEKTNLRKTGLEEEQSERKIIYIPQRYLNQLSEKEIQSRQTLNNFILGILLQDENASKYYEQKKSEISKAEKETSKQINELFSTREDIEKIQIEIKNLGDEKGITRFIENLKKQIEVIKKKSGLSQEQINKYEELTEKIKELEEKNTSLTQYSESLENFAEALKEQVDTAEIFEEYQEYFSDEDIRKLILNGFGFVKKLSGEIETARKKMSVTIQEKIKANEKQLIPLRKDLAPFLSKVKMQSELEEKRKLLKKEEDKLSNVQNKKRNLQAKQKVAHSKKNTILKFYGEVFSSYESLQNEFKKYSTRLKDIDLNIVVGFNDVEFNKEVVNQFLNKADIKKRPDSKSLWTEEFEYAYDPTNHIKFISSVFNGLLSEEIKTVKGRPAKDALQKLLENKFYVDFKISYKTDSLDKMSPGKKGLVLLKILIDLSNEEWPIILDQPEDDLDNRSVYTDLVSFIKTKKTRRQIIIATHNPNLVVGADSEEIAVANQSGQDIGRENDRYRFEYTSGALEDSFKNTGASGVLNQMGIREHVCEVLEGGEEAFQKREQKYSLKK